MIQEHANRMQYVAGQFGSNVRVINHDGQDGHIVKIQIFVYKAPPRVNSLRRLSCFGFKLLNVICIVYRIAYDRIVAKIFRKIPSLCNLRP